MAPSQPSRPRCPTPSQATPLCCAGPARSRWPATPVAPSRPPAPIRIGHLAVAPGTRLCTPATPRQQPGPAPEPVPPEQNGAQHRHRAPRCPPGSKPDSRRAPPHRALSRRTHKAVPRRMWLMERHVVEGRAPQAHSSPSQTHERARHKRHSRERQERGQRTVAARPARLPPCRSPSVPLAAATRAARVRLHPHLVGGARANGCRRPLRGSRRQERAAERERSRNGGEPRSPPVDQRAETTRGARSERGERRLAAGAALPDRTAAA
jgi:hypothetical protein